MKYRYWTPILLLVISKLTEAGNCLAETNAQVVQSAAYLSCKTASGIDFTGKGKASLDPLLFCSNADCTTLWHQLDRLGYLQCLQAYDGTEFRLRFNDSATACFAKYGKSTTVVPVSPSSAPATQATVGSATFGTSNVGGGGSAVSSSSATSPAESTSTTTTATSDGVTPSPETRLSAMALTQESSTGSTGSPTATSNGGADEGSQTGDSSGYQKREAHDESATLTSTANTNANTNVSTSGTQATAPSTPSSGAATVPGSTASTGATRGSSILWIAMGCGVAVVVLVAIGLVFVRGPSNKPPVRKKQVNEFESTPGYVATLHSSRSRHSSSGSISILESSGISSRTAVWDDEVIEAIRIPYEKITIGTLLSRGGFGEVYRGMYRNQAVAIKSLLPERREDMGQIRNFFEEIKLMALLKHEHIVQLVGVAWDSLNELCVVSEFMPRGDLRSLLVQYQAKEAVHPRGFTQDKIKIALYVAHALTYMHSLQPLVLHRDLKSRNILLNETLDAKLTDFGVSRERADSTMTIGVGSTLWMAPEVMTGGRYDDKADVFSFGVVLSELATHTLPYSHALEPGFRRRLPDAVVVQMMSTGRLTVEFTDKSPMAELGHACVALDPKERPTAAEVQHQIHQLWRNSTASE